VVEALETLLRAVSARLNARLLARRFDGPTDERDARDRYLLHGQKRRDMAQTAPRSR